MDQGDSISRRTNLDILRIKNSINYSCCSWTQYYRIVEEFGGVNYVQLMVVFEASALLFQVLINKMIIYIKNENIFHKTHIPNAVLSSMHECLNDIKEQFEPSQNCRIHSTIKCSVDNI